MNRFITQHFCSDKAGPSANATSRPRSHRGFGGRYARVRAAALMASIGLAMWFPSSTCGSEWSGGTTDIFNNISFHNLVISGGTNTIHGGDSLYATGGTLTINSSLEFSGLSSPVLTLSSDASGGIGGILSLNGNVSFTGTAGTAAIANGNRLIDDGFGNITDSGSTGPLPGTISLNGAPRVFNIANGSSGTDMLVSALITNGGLTKDGAGTLALSFANTYTGVTRLSAGVLSVATIGNGGVAGNLGQATSAASNIIFDGGTLQYSGATAISDRAFTITAASTATIDVTVNSLSLAGATGSATSGGLAKIGAGTLVLTGTNTFTGPTDVQNGTLRLTGSLDSATTLNLGNGTSSGKLILGDASGAVSQVVAALTTTGTGTTNAVVGGFTSLSTLTVNNATANNFAGTLGGAGANENNLALTKTGVGTLMLTGASTYTGPTDVQNGVVHLTGSLAPVTALNLGNGTGSGKFILGDGTGLVNQTVAALTTAGTGTSNAVVGGFTSVSTLTVNNAAANTFAGTLGGTGTNENNLALIKSGVGSLTLSAASTYTGNTVIAGGMLLAKNTSGSATGLGNITFSGTGGTFAGTGSVSGNVTLNNVATIAPGDGGIGTLTTGSQDWQSGGTYVWEIENPAGVAGTTGWDLLTINGDLTRLGGTFKIQIVQSGDAADPTVTSTPYDPAGSAWFTVAHVTGTAVPLDKAAFASLFQLESNVAGEEWEGRIIDLGGGGGFDVQLRATPEPASLSLVALGAMGLLSRRRRRMATSV